jgi:ubiquitin-activating enzyme E1 C
LLVLSGIIGVDYKLVQGVVKNIIPAVASSNAAIAAACTTEVFKLATSICKPLNNYMVFNNADGIYTYSYPNEKKVVSFWISQKKLTPLDIKKNNNNSVWMEKCKRN